MLLAKSSRVEEMVVLSLASTPNQSAKHLHQAVNQEFGEVSLQAIYQELKKLEAAGVILKYKRQYSLALHWVLELASFSDRLYDRYTEPDVVGPLPGEGETVKWSFHSIASLVPVWTHFVLSMAQNSRQRTCYEYMDHVFFHLCNSTVEQKLLKAMQSLGVKHYLAVGSDSYLDKRYSTEVTTDELVLRYGSRVFASRKEHYISSIGPYVLRIRPKKSFLSEIEEFFESITSSKQFHAGDIAEFVTRRTLISLTITNNKVDAGKVERAFGRYFVD